MGNITQADNTVIDYTTIQSIIAAVEELQKVVGVGTGTTTNAVSQVIAKGLNWVANTETSHVIDYGTTAFAVEPVVVATMVHNHQSTAFPTCYIVGKPSKTQATVKFSGKLGKGAWISWIAIGTASSK